MFLRSDHGLEQGGGTSALSFGRVDSAPPRVTLADRLRDRFPDFDPVPDLGSRIGSGEWFRGVATCAGLCAVTLLLSPGFERPIYGHVTPALTGADAEEARSQAIAPLALGATTGRRMAATSLVAPLTDTPERPIIELTAVFGRGDGFASVLQRSGLAASDAQAAAGLVTQAVALGDIKPGTRIDLTLGRRAAKTDPRPLEKLSFRARFDLNLELVRGGGGLMLNRHPIAIDNTPLRVRGRVGGSLYRSARAAGVPVKAVEALIKSLATRIPMSRIGGDDQFDVIVEQARAATGEVQIGNVLYAGLDQGGSRIRLVRWEDDGKVSWYDPNGIGERRGMMTMPVNGRISSNYGYRTHPVLGFRRLHRGMDIAAPYGTPIRAAADGVVILAGRAGGYGNFVKVSHSGGLTTGYGHMSRIAVRSGTRVSAGQVIGYVGSTGLSTGPHLHYELWRNGASINPRSVSFSTVERLGGDQLRAFRTKVAALLAVPAGAN